MTGETLINVAGGIVVGAAALTALYVATNWAPERTVSQLRARWGRPPSTFINVAGMTVHLRDEGPRDDPSPTVLLHPTVSSLHTWDGWTEALKEQRRVIRFDLRGFGLTGPSPDGRYGFDEDVRLAIAVFDHLGVERCVMGGNSLGGGVSWRTAVNHPSRVEKLILVDSEGYATTPISAPLAFYFSWLPMHNWMVRNTFPRAPCVARQAFRYLAHQIVNNPHKAMKQFMKKTPPCDKELLKDEALTRAYQKTVAECKRGGSNGLIEAIGLEMKDCGFRLQDIKANVSIWQGGLGNIVPPRERQIHGFHASEPYPASDPGRRALHTHRSLCRGHAA